jgi:subtilisin family serine protease
MRRHTLYALAGAAATTTLLAGLAVPGTAAAWTVAAAPGRPAGATHAAAPDPAAAPAGTGTANVTLITGDRVAVRGGRVTAIRPGPGRAGTRFVSDRIGGRIRVVPSDALSLLAAGTVDPRLFDVTTLLEFGYDDRRDLPLLVTYPASTAGAPATAQATARSVVVTGGARVTRELAAVGALAVRAGDAERAALWRSLTGGGTGRTRTLAAPVRQLWLDGKRKLSLDKSVPQIGAPAAWKVGLDGRDVTVAVLDTGIDATHPDLAGQVSSARNFTESPEARDTVGHGTHVASTIAGTGAGSQGRFRGVAPGARLLDGKVCTDDGCTDSALLAGMEWAAQQGAQVVNMSLGGPDQPGIDPLEKAVGDLTARYGTLFVVAAGNDGEAETVGSPASADVALAVGAIDRKDAWAPFSSRGPRLGDDAIKPEITAPGVEIVAARSSATAEEIGEPSAVKGYVTLSGTSMATPHVAGAAALLTQQHPGWSAAQRKAALMAAAKPTRNLDVYGQGAGRVDIARGITQVVLTEPVAVNFGRQRWPHSDDTPDARTVTYRNTGTATVTLALTATATGPTGKAAPSGAFTLSTAKVTVPAGGSAGVTLTSNSKVAGPEGLYSGFLRATGSGGVQVQTPFGLHREVKSHDLTLVHTDRAGGAPADHLTTIIDLKSGRRIDIGGEDATVTRRLPDSDYGIYSYVITAGAGPFGGDLTMLVRPLLKLRGNNTVALDARLGKPMSVKVPHAGARPAQVFAAAAWGSIEEMRLATFWAPDFTGFYTARIGPPAAVKDFTAVVRASLGQFIGDEPRDSPYVYDLLWHSKGRMFTGLDRTYRAKDLATIKEDHAREGSSALVGAEAWLPLLGDWAPAPEMVWTYRLPSVRTAYLNAEPGVTWMPSFAQQGRTLDPDGFPDVYDQRSREEARYVAGRTYTLHWNRAPFAPSVGADAGVDLAYRDGNVISTSVPLLVDRDRTMDDFGPTKATAVLYRNGKKIKTVNEATAEFTVGSGAATYRLEQTTWQRSPHTLSTWVRAAWTFRSKRTSGLKTLPLSTVNFTAPLNRDNAVKAGSTATVGITVERQPGAGKNKKLTVEVSFDDGKTWRKVAVRAKKDKLTVVVKHPRRAGYVSLRAKATDTGGASLTQTVVRAYRIG